VAATRFRLATAMGALSGRMIAPQPTRGSDGLGIYHSSRWAMAVGVDSLFPAASKDQLGLGRYLLGPGIMAAAPMARVRSMVSLQT